MASGFLLQGINEIQEVLVYIEKEQLERNIGYPVRLLTAHAGGYRQLGREKCPRRIG
jgi:hypothetical protein